MAATLQGQSGLPPANFVILKCDDLTPSNVRLAIIVVNTAAEAESLRKKLHGVHGAVEVADFRHSTRRPDPSISVRHVPANGTVHPRGLRGRPGPSALVYRR